MRELDSWTVWIMWIDSHYVVGAGGDGGIAIIVVLCQLMLDDEIDVLSVRLVRENQSAATEIVTLCL